MRAAWPVGGTTLADLGSPTNHAATRRAAEARNSTDHGVAIDWREHCSFRNRAEPSAPVLSDLSPPSRIEAFRTPHRRAPAARPARSRGMGARARRPRRPPAEDAAPRRWRPVDGSLHGRGAGGSPRLRRDRGRRRHLRVNLVLGHIRAAGSRDFHGARSRARILLRDANHLGRGRSIHCTRLRSRDRSSLHRGRGAALTRRQAQQQGADAYERRFGSLPPHDISFREAGREVPSPASCERCPRNASTHSICIAIGDCRWGPPPFGSAFRALRRKCTAAADRLTCTRDEPTFPPSFRRATSEGVPQKNAVENAFSVVRGEA